MRKTDQAKNDILRDEILNAAQALFCAHGLTMTTMESIAAAAGKSKATIYYYFKDKEDVVSALITRGRTRASKEIERAVNRAGSAEDRLRTFFYIRSKIINRVSELYPLIYHEQKKYIELFYKLRRENTCQEADLLKKILIDGVRSGEFRHITEKDCGVIAKVETDSFQGRYLKQVFEGRKRVNTSADDIMLDIFLRGMK